MNNFYINDYDWPSLNIARNRWVDGRIIVTDPPVLVKQYKYLNEPDVYSSYGDIKRGRIRYGNGEHLRSGCFKIVQYPMNSYLEDCELPCMNLNNTWNTEINDNLIYKHTFQTEAEKQIRQFDYPYLEINGRCNVFRRR